MSRSSHTHQYFTVELPRTAEFPMDMLRFDQAWPADTADATMIETLLHKEDSEIALLPRLVTINLESCRADAPEMRRWASFGIRVIDGGNGR